MERIQQQEMAQNTGGNSGGGSSGGSGGSGENINIDLGGFGGLFNWALGWAWGDRAGIAAPTTVGGERICGMVGEIGGAAAGITTASGTAA
jgi:hypothetical protein